MQCLLTTLNASVLSVERTTNRSSVRLPSCCVSVCECASSVCACFVFFWPIFSILLFFSCTQEVCIFVSLSVCNFVFFFSFLLSACAFELLKHLSASLRVCIISPCVCVRVFISPGNELLCTSTSFSERASVCLVFWLLMWCVPVVCVSQKVSVFLFSMCSCV